MVEQNWKPEIGDERELRPKIETYLLDVAKSKPTTANRPGNSGTGVDRERRVP